MKWGLELVKLLLLPIEWVARGVTAVVALLREITAMPSGFLSWLLLFILAPGLALLRAVYTYSEGLMLSLLDLIPDTMSGGITGAFVWLDRVFPLDATLTCLVAVMQVRFVVWMYRFVKSWVPTVSGSG